MPSNLTSPKESATRKWIDNMLSNLGWIIDETKPICNCFTERAKTLSQNKTFKGKKPDYVLYKSSTDTPIAIIEAKRAGQSLKDALEQAIHLYANPLGVHIIFVTDGSLVETYDSRTKGSLKIDGEIVTDLLSERELLQFYENGSELFTPAKVSHTKRELIGIFKEANELLRKEGMREGVERFTEFSNFLFLKLISEIEKEREKNGEKRILEEQYCWERFSKKEPKEMMDYINDIILPRLVNKYNHSGDVFQTKLLIQNPDTLWRIVEKLSNLKLVDTDSDIKGDAFEYFLKNSVTVGNDLGEFFTPRHIVKLIVELVDPKFGDTVYDPCCGTGGFLIQAFRHVKKKCKLTKENLRILEQDTIYGRELTGTAKIAKMNMIIIGDGHTNIQQMDSLKSPVKDEYSVVLTNFPFSQRTDYSSYYGFETEDANAVFLKHIIDALKDGGRAGVIVPDGLLFDEQADYVRVRRMLLETCKVLAVIKLHNFVFRPFTGQPTSILIFEKGTPTTDVWFFDVQEDGFKKSSSKMGRLPVKENDLPLLRQVWDEKSVTERSWFASIQQITDKNYNLSTDKYKPKNTGERKFDDVELQTIADAKLGKTPKKTQYNSDREGFKILKYRDVSDTGHIIWDNDDEGWINAEVKGLREIQDGDILLVASGHSAESIGTKAALVSIPSGLPTPVYYVGELLRVRIFRPKDEILPEYLMKYLLTSEGYEAIHKCVEGVHLTQGRAKKMKIVKPPFAVQKKLMEKVTAYKRTIEECVKTMEKAKKEQFELIEKFLND